MIFPQKKKTARGEKSPGCWSLFSVRGVPRTHTNNTLCRRPLALEPTMSVLNSILEKERAPRRAAKTRTRTQTAHFAPYLSRWKPRCGSQTSSPSKNERPGQPKNDAKKEHPGANSDVGGREKKQKYILPRTFSKILGFTGGVFFLGGGVLMNRGVLEGYYGMLRQAINAPVNDAKTLQK